MRRTPARTLLLPALLAALLATGPPPAAATQVTLESRTYFPAEEDGQGGQHIGAYEYLDLGLSDTGVPGLYVGAGGWGRFDLADETHGRKSNGDLQYGFLGYRGGSRNTEARLGRLAVTAGAARNEVLDGLQLGSDLPGGFAALAYGGIPVETDAAGRGGDAIWGGRLSQALPGRYDLGVSYLREDDDGELARSEALVDLWARPGLPLSILGSSLYNVDSEGFARHDWRILSDPFLGGARAGLRYSWTDYGAFFTAPDVTAFAAPILDPDERLQSYGADLEVPLAPGFAITGDYTAYRYEIAPGAERYGGRLGWEGGSATAGLAYHNSHGDDSFHRYDEYALDATLRLGDARLALGAQELRYARDINGTRDSLTVFAAADYDLSAALSLGADIEYQNSPSYESRVRGMLKLVWRYAHDTGAGQGGVAP